jgi:hypothetical protein
LQIVLRNKNHLKVVFLFLNSAVSRENLQSFYLRVLVR